MVDFPRLIAHPSIIQVVAHVSQRQKSKSHCKVDSRPEEYENKKFLNTMPLKKEPVSRAFSVPRWQQVHEKTNVRFEVQRDSGFIRKTTISLSSLPQSPRPFSGSKTRRNLFPSRLIRPSDGQCRVTDEG